MSSHILYIKLPTPKSLMLYTCTCKQARPDKFLRAHKKKRMRVLASSLLWVSWSLTSAMHGIFRSTECMLLVVTALWAGSISSKLYHRYCFRAMVLDLEADFKPYSTSFLRQVVHTDDLTTVWKLPDIRVLNRAGQWTPPCSMQFSSA